MSTVSGGATTTNSGTASSNGAQRSYRCYNCHRHLSVKLKSAVPFCCLNLNCHRIYEPRYYSLSLPSTSSNPNPNYASAAVYGPLAPNSIPTPTATPLHSSDYRTATKQPQPTSKSFIKYLPRVRITGSPSESCSESCAVCKEDFECGEGVNQLPCNHVFHYECIVPWLNRSNSCPLCRYKLPSELKPRLFVVILGNLIVEGWGKDYRSGFRDAVFQNRLLIAASNRQSSLSWPSSPSLLLVKRIRGGQTPAMPSFGREGYGNGSAGGLANGIVNGVCDEDGDIVMVDGTVNVVRDEDGDTVMVDAL